VKRERTAITAEGAPRVLGPYAQAVAVGDLVFCAGQVGLDPASGRLGDIVKTTVYLVDLGEFAAMNAVYGRYFSPPYPARATVGVAALPAGARVEIEAVAVRR